MNKYEQVVRHKRNLSMETPDIYVLEVERLLQTDEQEIQNSWHMQPGQHSPLFDVLTVGGKSTNPATVWLRGNEFAVLEKD